MTGFALVTLLSSWVVIYSNITTFMYNRLFLFFFFVSALLSIVSGYIASSIPKITRSSLNLLITNILGNFPEPFIYGFLQDNFKNTNPRLPWKNIIHMLTLEFLSSLGNAFFSYKQLEKFEEDENKKKEKDRRRIKNVDNKA
jgi:hypothetical protein